MNRLTVRANAFLTVILLSCTVSLRADPPLLKAAPPKPEAELPEGFSSSAAREWASLNESDFRDGRLINSFVARHPGAVEADAAVVARYIVLYDSYCLLIKQKVLDVRHCEALLAEYEEFVSAHKERAIADRARFDLFDLARIACRGEEGDNVIPLARFVRNHPDQPLALPALRIMHQIAYVQTERRIADPKVGKNPSTRLLIFNDYLSQYPDAPQAALLHRLAVEAQIEEFNDARSRAKLLGEKGVSAEQERVRAKMSRAALAVVRARKNKKLDEWDCVRVEREAERLFLATSEVWKDEKLDAEATDLMRELEIYDDLRKSIATLGEELKAEIKSAKFEIIGDTRMLNELVRRDIIKAIEKSNKELKEHLIAIENKVDRATQLIFEVSSEVKALRKEVEETRKEVAGVQQSVNELRKTVVDFQQNIKAEFGEMSKKLDQIADKIPKRGGMLSEVCKAVKVNAGSFSKDFKTQTGKLKSAGKRLIGALLPGNKLVVYEFSTDARFAVSLVSGEIGGTLSFDEFRIDFGLVVKALSGQDVSGKELLRQALNVDLNLEGSLKLAAQAMLLRVDRTDEYMIRRSEIMNKAGDGFAYYPSKRFTDQFGPEEAIKDIGKAVATGGATSEADIEKYRRLIEQELADLALQRGFGPDR